MSDYERRQLVDAPADALFDYLADVRNLPQYFWEMTRAEPADGGTVRVSAGGDGQEQEVKAWLRVDHERLHMDWGSEGPHNCYGRLDVTAAGDVSQVVVALNTGDTNDDRIEKGLTDTLSEIQRLATGPQRCGAYFDIVVARA